MTRSEALYRSAPDWLQTLMISAYGGKLLWLRRGRSYWRWTRFLEQSASWSREQLEAYQLRRLREFLEHAARHSDFFRERLAGVDVRSLADLAHVPETDKETFREALPRIRAIPRGVVVHTGGTTGKPLEVLFAPRDIQERMATLDAWRETHGAGRWTRRATFSGRIVVPPDAEPRSIARTNLVLRQRLYSSFHLHERYLDRYVDDLEAFQPAMIDGFPSAIATVAAHMLATRRTGRVRPAAVFSTSENLYDHQRCLMQEAFGCEVRNQYASAEGAPFVVECERGSLHYDLRTGVIEQADDGTVLVTSFTTHGTPLVRYRIGDRMELTREECGCGNHNPVVRAISGREQDYIVSPERGMVGVGLIDIFKMIPPVVKQAQVDQVSRDAIDVRLVADRAAWDPAYLDVLREGLVERVGTRMQIRFVFVDRIEPEAGGKIRYVKRSAGDAGLAPAGVEVPE